MKRIFKLTFLFATTLFLLNLGVKSVVYADPGDVISRQFSGQVFYGYPGDTEEPLEGLTVALYGSYDEEPLTDPLAESTTNQAGIFSIAFDVLEENDFPVYTLRVEDDSGALIAASAVGDGTAESHVPGNLRFEYIPSGMFGNLNFWLRAGSTTPPSTIPILMILVESSSAEIDEAHSMNTPALFRQLLNTGTTNIVDYFDENSQGNFSVTPATAGDKDGTADGIVGWYTLNPAEYDIIKRREKAIQAADQDFDFSIYDTKSPTGVITSDELLVVTVIAESNFNEWGCVLRDKEKFDTSTFQRETRSYNGDSYEVIKGRIKGTTTTEDYAYRYWAWSHPTRDVWTRANAYTHCTQNHGQTLQTGFPKWEPNPGQAGGTVRGLGQDVTTSDGVKFGRGFEMAAVNQWTNFMTHVHEISHLLSPWAADLYNYDDNGTFRYALMDATVGEMGSVHHDPFTKMKLGWLQPKVITKPGWVTLNSVETNGDVLKLMAGGRTNEYFLVENRWSPTSDYDGTTTAANPLVGLPGPGIPDDGLAIWHVQEDRFNAFRKKDYNFPAYLNKEDAGLTRATALWDGSKSFHNGSVPSSDWNDGTSSGLVITCISAPGPTMTAYIDFATNAPLIDDAYEPNNSPGAARSISSGVYDLTLAAPCDDDYFKMTLSDYADISVSVKAFSDANHETPITGPDLVLFQGTSILASGKGPINLTEVSPRDVILKVTSTSKIYYELTITKTNSVMEPDRFDDQLPAGEPRNDTFSTAANVTTTVGADNLIPRLALRTLNFDTTADIDYFQIQLDSRTDPNTGEDECLPAGDPRLQDSNTHQGRLEIKIQADTIRPFRIKLYNSSGTVVKTVTGTSLLLDCPYQYFSNGKLTVSVEDTAGRNKYSLFVGYRRWATLLQLPPWLTLTEPPLFNWVLPAFPEWVQLIYPLDPVVQSEYLNGNIQAPFPSEYLLFDWSQPGLYQLNIDLPAGGDLTFELVNELGEVMAQSYPVASPNDPGGPAYGQLSVSNLPAGIYAIVVNGNSFGTPYILNSPLAG